MMFNGHWLRYSGLYPSYQVRFGRRERLRGLSKWVMVNASRCLRVRSAL